nr:hypothetical protein BaRGS_007070 [Batillaria attramentaria]
MIRVGARAPAPPPIASPKGRPTLNRDHVTGGRLVRVRQSGDLRDRVVQLARRKEERNENHIPTCTSGSQPQGDRSQSHTADDKQVTIVVYDLHKGNASTTVTRRAARVLSSAHTPAPPSQEPTKRDHLERAPPQSSRPGDCEVQCEVRGNALHSHQSPVTSPRRHDRHANGFSASLEMFKRRLRLNQNK